jgi:hypothetical protein
MFGTDKISSRCYCVVFVSSERLSGYLGKLKVGPEAESWSFVLSSFCLIGARPLYVFNCFLVVFLAKWFAN